jgi:hypothetical protein
MPRSLRHWEITREKGLPKFLLQTGLLSGLVLSLLDAVHGNPSRFSGVVTFCINISVGVISGALAWVLNERRYRRYVDEQIKPPDA